MMSNALLIGKVLKHQTSETPSPIVLENILLTMCWQTSLDIAPYVDQSSHVPKVHPKPIVFPWSSHTTLPNLVNSSTNFAWVARVGLIAGPKQLLLPRPICTFDSTNLSHPVSSRARRCRYIHSSTVLWYVAGTRWKVSTQRLPLQTGPRLPSSCWQCFQAPGETHFRNFSIVYYRDFVTGQNERSA